MGTTLATIYAVKGKVICVNIGDSRVYHYSKGILEQISFDHTHAQTIVDAGEVSMDNIGQIPDAKRLTRHLGIFPEEGGLSPNISVIDDVDDGDIILLCSDGLTDMLSDEEITSILSTGENAQGVASKLVRRALEVGGKDNITVMTAFMNVEETAIFAPIAAAMVGDSDADYEEEYRNSFGGMSTQNSEEETAFSPYAKADARAHEKSVDKSKIMKIVGIVIAVVILLLGGALALKGILGDKDPDDESLSSTTFAYENTTYPVYSPPILTTNPITTWSFEPSESESETDDESTTEETTRKRVTTTRKKTTTTRKKTTTTRRQSSTTRRTSSTTRRSSTTAKAEDTTAKRETTSATVPSGTTAPASTTRKDADSTTRENTDTTTRRTVTTTRKTTSVSTTRGSSSDSTTSALGGFLGDIEIPGVEFSDGYIITG